MEKNETPTRELDCPRTEIGDGMKVISKDKAYIIIQDRIEDWWALLDPDADDGPPLLLQDKQKKPNDRNF